MYIKFSNVSKSFNNSKVLDDINLDINKGNVMLIVGKNGAGKTTLLRLLLRIYTLDEGEITVDGISVKSKNYYQIKERIGFLNDNLGLFRDLTAWDNVEFFYRIYQPKAQKKQRDEEIIRVLKRVDLYENKDRKIDFFSRGMKQRLAIARAIVNNPDILILDEPYRGLDVEGKEMIKDIVNEFEKKGATIIINSHDLNDMQEIVSHVAFLNKGKIICTGSYEELSSESNKRYTLVVKDPKNVMDKLEKLSFVKNVFLNDNVLTVDLYEDTAKLSYWLSSNNIEIYELKKINIGLTALYKKYIK
jgi:ABC-2 type transport system ATP-binding protein